MPEVAVKIYPAGATPRRVDVDHGSGERTAGVAVAAIQDILKQEDYQPQFLKDLIRACRAANQTLPSPEAIIINGKPYSVRSIREHLAKFVYLLPPEKRPAFADDSLYNDSFLDHLSGIIDEVSGLASPQPAGAEAGPSTATIPPDLKALVEQFEKTHQDAVSAQAKRQGWSPEEFRKQIALQNQITIQLGVVRQATLSQLGLVIDNSQYLENLAASLGVPPEAVKRLAKIRLQILVDQSITAQTFRQARLISQHPSQLAALFTKNLSDNLKLDDLVGMTVATNKKDAKKAIESIKSTVTQETEKAKPAIQAAAENLARHPSVQKAAQQDAVLAAGAAVAPSLPSGTPGPSPAKTSRLVKQLVRHRDNPSVQEKIITAALKVSPAQAKVIRTQLSPQISQLAASTQRFNPLLAADPTSILADALRNPGRFPKPFVDAIKLGKISDDQIATIIQTANLLGVPVSAVTFSYFGVESSQVKINLTRGRAALPADHPTIVTLSRLASAQIEINKARQQNLLPPSLEKDLLSSSRHYTRAIRWNKFTESINPFRLFTGIGARLNEIPQFSGTLSGFRVQSGPIDSVFNFMGSLGNTTRSLPGFITRPFAAVGNAISNTIINPVKTWANTQIKSGLAKAGSWLAKKGVTEAAKKLGLALIGKGTAALLAQAVPVAGQVAGALMLLSTLGDIGKFIWANRKEIGFGLAGGFLLGQLLLGKILGFLSSLGTVGLTTGIGALIGTFIFPGIGTAIGAGLGFGAGLMINAAGGLGAALSGLGTALGSAAASLGSFLGSLTAPSLIAGISGSFAVIGLGGLGLTAALVIFFIQPTINSALFVAPDSGTFPTGCPAQIWPLDLAQGQRYAVTQGPGGWCSHGPPLSPQPASCGDNTGFSYAEAIDIGTEPPNTIAEANTVIATHPGVVQKVVRDDNIGNYVRIQDSCGGNFTSVYVHMEVIPENIKEGVIINGGEMLGVVGDSGAPAQVHLHYEFRESDGIAHKQQGVTAPPFMTVPYIPITVPVQCVGRSDAGGCNISIP